MRCFLGVLLVCLLLLGIGPAPAAAQTVNIILSPNSVSGAAGANFSIQSTLSNTSGSTAFINGSIVSLPAPGVTVSSSPFLVNAPTTLANGASAGPFNALDITITGAATPGVYVGTFTILGGSNALEMNVIGTVNFTVTVLSAGGGSSAPEGEGMLLLVTALPALGLLRRKREVPPPTPRITDWGPPEDETDPGTTTEGEGVG